VGSEIRQSRARGPLPRASRPWPLLPRLCVKIDIDHHLPFALRLLGPGRVQVPCERVQIDLNALEFVRIALHGLQDLLQPLGYRAEGLLDLVEHAPLLVIGSAFLHAAAQEVIGPHEEVLDVVRVRFRHDADRVKHLRFQLQGLALGFLLLPFGFLAAQLLFELSAFGNLLLAFGFLAAQLLLEVFLTRLMNLLLAVLAQALAVGLAELDDEDP
jgi:hypothetical protein